MEESNRASSALDAALDVVWMNAGGDTIRRLRGPVGALFLALWPAKKLITACSPRHVVEEPAGTDPGRSAAAGALV
jgi:hypothetical protein